MREKCLRSFLFAGTNFCGLLEKSQKLEPAKISCDTVFDLAFYLFLAINYAVLRKYLLQLLVSVGSLSR